MGTYSFKSSGTTKANATAQALVVTLPVIGIITPLSLGTTDIVTTTTDIGVAMTDNLRNLITTNWGERLGLYNFGANLRPLMSDLVSQDDFDTKAINNIRQAVQQWMPFVDLQNFTSAYSQTQNNNTAVIQLNITFNIPSLGVKNKMLQVTLYAI